MKAGDLELFAPPKGKEFAEVTHPLHLKYDESRNGIR